MEYRNQSSQPKEIDVFNRFSRHNKIKTVVIAVTIAVVSFFVLYFVTKSMFSYTIKFVADGGRVYGQELEDEYRYRFLERTKLPEGLKKPGYYIAGFYKDAKMKHEFEFGKPMWRSRTIYIDWQPGYAVVLDFVNGEDNVDRIETDKTDFDLEYLKIYHEQYVAPGVQYTLPRVFNDKAGNKHYNEQLLWYDNEKGEGEPFEIATFDMTEDIHIYGKWFDTQESKFNVDENGELQRYLGDCSNIILPNNIRAIKNIPNDKFKTEEWDTTRVQDGTYYSAFDKVLDQLEILYVNDNMETLGANSFRGCENLKTVKFKGNKITTIPDYCFAYCYALERIDLPINVTSIGERAFDNAKHMKYITGTENVTEIFEYAFGNAEWLQSINLPKLQKIHKCAFTMCMRLKSVYFTNPNVIEMHTGDYGCIHDEFEDNIFNGAISASSPIIIYVPTELENIYKSSPYWSIYENRYKPYVASN